MGSLISEDEARKWCSENLSPFSERCIDSLTELLEKCKQHEDLLWKQAVIEKAVVNWCYKNEHEHNPRLALNDIIAQVYRESVDPQISLPAVKLLEQGIQKGLSCAISIVKEYSKPNQFIDSTTYQCLSNITKELSELKISDGEIRNGSN